MLYDELASSIERNLTLNVKIAAKEAFNLPLALLSNPSQSKFILMSCLSYVLKAVSQATIYPFVAILLIVCMWLKKDPLFMFRCKEHEHIVQTAFNSDDKLYNFNVLYIIDLYVIKTVDETLCFDSLEGLKTLQD
jgi:hypothetical protein